MLCKEKDILPLREQAKLADEILADRLKNLMPTLLDETGTEMWVVLCREYNEDPVFQTLTPTLVKNASRTSCFVFSKKGEDYRAYSLSRPDARLAPFYDLSYQSSAEELFSNLINLIGERAPKKIAVNICEDCALADGMCQKLWTDLVQALPDTIFVNDGNMAVRWLEARTEKELARYPKVYEIAMQVLREAYSLQVITPGVTTTTDVEWFIMQRINDMGLDAWFAPDVDLQRKGNPAHRLCDVVIQEGDLLHTDMGLTYLGELHTDSQRLGYVLCKSEGETTIPQGILDGFATGNRFQDIVTENMIAGKTGNDIFFAAIAQAEKENIRAELYTHPIGVYGHGAGPLIGLYGAQGFVKGRGERILHPDTCYALELNICQTVPEWDNQDVRFMLEETICYRGDGNIEFLDADRKNIQIIG